MRLKSVPPTTDVSIVAVGYSCITYLEAQLRQRQREEILPSLSPLNDKVFAQLP
jgi:hypothetical protein